MLTYADVCRYELEVELPFAVDDHAADAAWDRKVCACVRACVRACVFVNALPHA